VLAGWRKIQLTDDAVRRSSDLNEADDWRHELHVQHGRRDVLNVDRGDKAQVSGDGRGRQRRREVDIFAELQLEKRVTGYAAFNREEKAPADQFKR
jgi:hypothetical protein